MKIKFTLLVMLSGILSFNISLFAQKITTVAGTGVSGYSGDGGLATGAEFDVPMGVAIDSAGNIYIADLVNNRIRKVSASTGIITTVAGDGTGGYAGDGGLATSAQLNYPYGVAVDKKGNIYIADYFNNCVRKVTASTGFISTLAGNGIAGYSGDGAAAINAKLDHPIGVAVDDSSNVFIVDLENSSIRKVSAATGFISTVAGNGNLTKGFSGDGALATSAQLSRPSGVTVDAAGNIYICDAENFRIRKVTASTGFINTIAGDGNQGFGGDGGLATSAQFNYPFGVAVDSAGNIYTSDVSNSRIRKIDVATGFVNTIAGKEVDGYSGDGGPAIEAKLKYPSGICAEPSGIIYFSDGDNYRIRKVNNGKPPVGDPTVLSAVAQSTKQIDLSWTDNSSEEDGFIIELSFDSLTFYKVDTVGMNVTFKAYTRYLVAATKYFFRVKAYTGNGSTAYSNIVTATTLSIPSTAPLAPSNLKGIAVSLTQIDLSWIDNSNDEFGFIIERGLDSINFSVIDTTSAGAIIFSDNTVAQATKYYYRVAAYNNIGNSAYTMIISVNSGRIYTAFVNALQNISAGTQHSLSVCKDGTIMAWGRNSLGQIGDGTTTDRLSPVQVSNLTGMKAVVGLGNSSIALKSDGTVWAWGGNAEGQLGNGTTTNSSTPVQVVGLTGIIAIEGGWQHGIALKGDSTVWTWGDNQGGQLGDGTTTNNPNATKVNGLTGIIAIAGGLEFSIAMKSNGTLWAWGSNSHGQFGNGTQISSSTPTLMASGLTDITAIACGYEHVLALKNDGTIWAWGRNQNNQLGDDGNGIDKKSPVQVNPLSGLTGAIAISAGESYSQALKSDGTLWNWGDIGNDFPELFMGSSNTNINTIAAGNDHFLTLKNDGTVMAWGKLGNTYGQLGNGTVNGNATLAQVTSLCAVTIGIDEAKKESIISVFPNPTSGAFAITLQNNHQITNLEVYNTLGEKLLQQQNASQVDISNSPKGVYFVRVYDGTMLYTQKIIIE